MKLENSPAGLNTNVWTVAGCDMSGGCSIELMMKDGVIEMPLHNFKGSNMSIVYSEC